MGRAAHLQAVEADGLGVGARLPRLAFAAPSVVLAPYAAAPARMPSLALVVVLIAAGGFFVPDLVLRRQVKRRRQAIFLDLPEAMAILSLSLGAGQLA